MKGNFEDIVRNKIESTEGEPAINLWDAIESSLIEGEFKSGIVEKLDAVEIPEPSGRVWSKIEASLHKAPPFSFQPYRNWFIAASLIIAFGTWLMFRNETAITITNSPIVKIEKPETSIPLDLPKAVDPQGNKFMVEYTQTNSEKMESLANVDSINQPEKVEQVETLQIAGISANSDSSASEILEELQFAQLPDSLFTSVNASEFSPVIPPVEITQVSNPKTKERPGSETAVNYLLTRILGLPKANVAIEQVAKGNKNVWKVNFDSRLLSFSGNLPSGKNAE